MPKTKKIKKEFIKAINMTPKWEEVIMLYAEAASNGVQSARAELLRCARMADKLNDLAKNLKAAKNLK